MTNDAQAAVEAHLEHLDTIADHCRAITPADLAPEGNPTVRVVGWNPKSALVIVDDVRVRIDRRGHGRTVWLCDEHGRRDDGTHCRHTGLAARAAATHENRNDAPKEDTP